MSQTNIYEQYMLELINAERAKTGAQPLAFDGDLNESAENHSSWMIATDTFSHTGAGGSNPGQRMTTAGYVFTGSWAWAENIAWMSTRTPAGFQDEITQLHSLLMNSAGHKSNILNGTFREVGIGFEAGQYGNYEGAFVTQNFARTASNAFLTGVAFDDLDGDKHYDINEGLSNFAVNAKNNATAAITTTKTGLAGGYEMELAPGGYTISFASNGFSTTSMQVNISSKNIKLDLIDPATSTPPFPFGTIMGTTGADTINGTAENNVIIGLAGRDIIRGNAGNDRIEGGAGADKLAGNAGTDILTGGTGKDIFVFDASFIGAIDIITDFSPIDDTIQLDRAIFTSLPKGKLNAAAFHIGTAAHDATDRIIYNAQTGVLSYDADGSGGTSTQQFAQLTGGLTLTHTDFYIF